MRKVPAAWVGHAPAHLAPLSTRERLRLVYEQTTHARGAATCARSLRHGWAMRLHTWHHYLHARGFVWCMSRRHMQEVPLHAQGPCGMGGPCACTPGTIIYTREASFGV